MDNLQIENISQGIFSIRGRQVMLDDQLAALYNVTTKRLMEQVRRNHQRFPEHFMFQITNDELKSLRSHFATLNSDLTQPKSRGQHRKYLPYAFTEHGISMLSAVLKSPMAIQVSIQIIETFVYFRNLVIVKNDYHWIQQSFFEMNDQIKIHEKKINGILDQMQINGSQFHQGIFFNNQIFDAYAFSSQLIKSAKKPIVLLDNYVDETTLLQLSKRNPKVKCSIYTEKISPELILDMEKHNAQYPPISIRTIKYVHDRFLILDNQELYHLGASLKDLGKRWFAFSRMDGMLPEVLMRLK
jgi:hypothetical protein